MIVDLALQSTERQEARSQVQARVGFPFNEAELSPISRQKITEIAGYRQRINYARWEISQLTKKMSDYNKYFIVSVIVGIILAIVVIGIFILIGAYYFYTQAKKTKARILNVDQEINNLLWQADTEATNLAQQITAEMSAIYQNRLSPVSVGGSQTLKETIIREVVMIPCAYCRGLMAQTALTCPHCGAQRRA
jgi:hypothetical protein